MKKLGLLFLVAALMLGFASCNSDYTGGGEYNPPVPGDVVPEGATISFTFNMGSDTRAVGPQQSQAPVRIDNGVILLSNTAGSIVRAVALAAVPNNHTQEFENVPAGVNRAHFVGNTDIIALLPAAVTSVDDLVGLPLTDVRNALVRVENQVQLAATPNPNHNRVNVWATSGDFFQTTPGQTNPSGNQLWEATLYVNPTVARVELFNITGNHDIRSFRVGGIFIDNYYAQARVGFGGYVPSWTSVSTGTTADRAILLAGSPQFPTAPVNMTGVTFDVVNLPSVPTNSRYATIGGVAQMAELPRVQLTNATGVERHVWGYNLFAGTGLFAGTPVNHPNFAHTIGGTRTPRIAIRLYDVVVYEEFTYTWQQRVYATTAPYAFIEIEDRELTVRVHLPHSESREEIATWAIPNPWTADNAPQGITPNNLLNTWYAITGATAEARQIAINAAAQTHFNGKFCTDEYGDYPLFISIRGFLHGGEELDANGRPIPNLLTGFVPRMVYQLGSYTAHGLPGSYWTFGAGDVTASPFERDIDLDVTVEILTWEHVSVTPAT